MNTEQQRKKLERQANRILANAPNPPRFTKHANFAGKRRKRNFACFLRHNQTDAEKKLYRALKKSGFHWHTQRLMLGWIVDFWCHPLKMVIEVDGGYHHKREQIEKDATRDRVMSSHGILIVRFKNEEIEADLPRVIARLALIVQDRREQMGIRPHSYPGQLIRGQGQL